MKFFPRKNGNVIVDATTVDALVDGLVSIDVVKCPNLYGTAYNVWESNDLATIFGVATTVEPLGTLVYASVLGNNYYDTFTGTITVGTGSDITITNTGETAVDIYVVDLTTLFTTEPNETQCDAMAKMFLFNGTGSELITLEEVFYVDYTGQVIHNLTDIYGTGNEPTLETHEALIPQYTNTVLKAKAFENTLQQEYMEVSLDTPVYENLSLRDIFEDGNLVTNGDFSTTDNWLGINETTLKIIDETFEFDMSASAGIRQLNINGLNTQILYIGLQSYVKSGTIGQYSLRFLTSSNVLASNAVNINTSNISFEIESGLLTASADFDRLQLAVTGIGDKIYVIDNIHLIPMSLFTTAPTQTQLDEWLDIYLTLTSANSKTGTAFVQDRFYIDYDNAKAYDYNIIAPYVAETPADIQAFMEDVLDKTITLAGIPDKMWIEKDRVVILGSYVVVGE